MKNLIPTIISVFLLFIGVRLIYSVNRFNRLRHMYISKFTFYRNHGLVHDSYCNIYLDIFEKFRLNMFFMFLFNKKTSLSCLIDNQSLYKNYLISCKKEKQRTFEEDPNNIWIYWKDQAK